jgi:hypothetical protein
LSFSPVLVFAKLQSVGAVPAHGQITLALSQVISDGETTITPAQSATAALDAEGTVAIVWPANDDSTTQPAGTYTVVTTQVLGAPTTTMDVVVSHLNLATLLTGTGAPSGGTGTNGQWYLDTENQIVYQAKTGGVWPTPGTAVTNLAGQTPVGVLDLATVAPALPEEALYGYVTAAELDAAVTAALDTLSGTLFEPIPAINVAGNLGASHTLALEGINTWFAGVLTANCNITVTGLTAGCSIVFLLQQNGTGDWTLEINSTAVTIPLSPDAISIIEAWSPDGTNLYVLPGPQTWTGATAGGDLTGTYPSPTLADTANVTAIVNEIVAANNLAGLESTATARTNLGLGSAATQASSAFDAAGAASAAQAAAEAASDPVGTATTVGNLKLAKASNLSDVADAGSSRANIHVPVLTPAACASTTALTKSGLQTIDGYTLNAGDLVVDLSNTVGAGLWTAASGSWTRPTEFASGAVIKGRSIEIQNGTVHALQVWVLTTPTAGITIDTTAQTWSMAFSGTFVATSEVGQPSGVAAVNSGGDTQGGVFPITGLSSATSPVAASISISLELTSSSPTATVVGNIPALSWGLGLSGTGIAGGTYIQGLTYKGVAGLGPGLSFINTITLSQNATATGTETISVAVDVNYKTIWSLYSEILTLGLSGATVQAPPGYWYFGYGLPPLGGSFVHRGHYQGTGYAATYPYLGLSWDFLPTYPAHNGNNHGRYEDLSFYGVSPSYGMVAGVTGAAGTGYMPCPGTSRLRGPNLSEMDCVRCSAQNFFFGLSMPGNHVRADRVTLSNVWCGCAIDYFEQNPGTQGSLEVISLSGGALFAGFSGGPQVWAGEIGGGATEITNALYGMVGVDYWDMVTGFPANMQLDVYLPATSTSTTTPTLAGPYLPTNATNCWAGKYAYVVSGTGAGAQAEITANTVGQNPVLTLASALTLSSTSVIEIYWGGSASGSVITVANGFTWDNTHFPSGEGEQPQGQYGGLLDVLIIEGTGAGDVFSIASDNGDAGTLTVSGSPTMDSTSRFQIVRGGPAFDSVSVPVPEGLAFQVVNGLFADLSYHTYGGSSIVATTFFLVSDGDYALDGIPGCPSSYAVDLQAATGLTLILSSGFGSVGYLRARAAGTTSSTWISSQPSSAATWFDSSSNLAGVAFAESLTPTVSQLQGMICAVSGTVTNLEPVQWVPSAPFTVEAFAGGTYAGMATATQTGGQMIVLMSGMVTDPVLSGSPAVGTAVMPAVGSLKPVTAGLQPVGVVMSGQPTVLLIPTVPLVASSSQSGLQGVPGLVTSPLGVWINSTAAALAAANDTYLWRVIVPSSGTLTSVAVYLGTLSGNVAVGVYDVGATTAGVYTQLYSSGLLAASGFTANAWNTIANPGLTVTAGQELALAFSADNTTVTVGRYIGLNSAGVMELPSGYWPINSIPPLIGGFTGSSMPSTISSITESQNMPFLIGLV